MVNGQYMEWKPHANPTQTQRKPHGCSTQTPCKTKRKRYRNFLMTPTVYHLKMSKLVKSMQHYASNTTLTHTLENCKWPFACCYVIPAQMHGWGHQSTASHAKSTCLFVRSTMQREAMLACVGGSNHSVVWLRDCFCLHVRTWQSVVLSKLFANCLWTACKLLSKLMRLECELLCDANRHKANVLARSFIA